MKKILILLVMLFSTSVSSLAWSLENYEDCILKNMKGGDAAAKAIKDACKAKHINSIFSICVETEAQIKNGIIFSSNMSEPFTGNNLCEYSNGQVKSKGEIKDGNLEGKFTTWYDNGEILSEKHYMEGTLVSETRYVYYVRGQKRSEIHYKDGIKDGKLTLWFESGLILSERHYKDGIKDGKWTLWFESGQILSERHYKNGILQGKFTTWYDNGEILSERYYEDGICISGDC